MSRLAYVAAAVADPAAVAATLERHFGLQPAKVETLPGRPAFAVGATALVLLAADDPAAAGRRTGVDHLGFAGIDAAGLRMLENATGIQARSAPALSPRDAAASNGLVQGFDHIGVASTDNAAAVAALVDGLGFPLESQQRDVEIRTSIESFTSDRYGVVYHARPPEVVGGLHVLFVTAGDCELEFLQDLNPAGDLTLDRGQAGNTRQDRSAVGRYIARRGPGLHHLAFRTRDIDGALATLARAGQPLIDRIGRPGSRRARIGFIHPDALGGLLVHFVERA
ncbi:MAG: VOC family protein [Alphaproteobacteria bacterium]